MITMAGFPLVAYLMKDRLGRRFRHLPPTVAAELEAAVVEIAGAEKGTLPAPAGFLPTCGLPRGDLHQIADRQFHIRIVNAPVR